MLKRIIAIICVVLVFTAPLTAHAAKMPGQANTQVYGQVGQITGDNVHIRRNPWVAADNSYGLLQRGQKFTHGGDSGMWRYCNLSQYGIWLQGWVHSAYCELLNHYINSFSDTL